MGHNFKYFDVIGPKLTEFGIIKQNNGHCGVQGHSWSPVLVNTAESPYAYYVNGE